MRVASVHFSAGPLLRRLTGYDAHVGARLPRQSAPAGEPVAHPARPGIVGSCGEPEISEGLKTILVTGDNERAAQWVAREVLRRNEQKSFLTKRCSFGRDSSTREPT